MFQNSLSLSIFTDMETRGRTGNADMSVFVGSHDGFLITCVAVVDCTNKMGKKPLLFVCNGLNMFLLHTRIRV